MPRNTTRIGIGIGKKNSPLEVRDIIIIVLVGGEECELGGRGDAGLARYLGDLALQFLQLRLSRKRIALIPFFCENI